MIEEFVCKICQVGPAVISRERHIYIYIYICIYMYICIFIYIERERDCLVLNIVLPESDMRGLTGLRVQVFVAEGVRCVALIG